jgi:uncharacterized protein (DUF2147 family)
MARMNNLFRTISVVAGAAVMLCAVSSALSAQGAAAKIDVTGKWAFAVQTGAGSGTPTFTFKQDGEKLTGHYSGQLGEAELTGSVKGNAITFSFTGEAMGSKVDATYTGTVESNDSMKGKVVLAGLGEGTFTGKRQ